MLNMSGLNAVESAVVKWQYRLNGGFYEALWSAITQADQEHLARLEEGFPLEVEGYRRYTTEKGWWESVERKIMSDPWTTT
jgi:hypothetical protein